MTSAEILTDEKERLATLRALRILDTSCEERYDRLTALACRLFNAPMAALSFVDETRNWFKSCRGIEVIEIPRQHSFCAHAILGKNIFVIPDTLLDERFRNNPFVVNDPKVRYYAGVPVAAPNGVNVGTFCILDKKPRQFSAIETRLFTNFAKLAEREIAKEDLAGQMAGVADAGFFTSVLEYVMEFSRQMNFPMGVLAVHVRGLWKVSQELGRGEADRFLISVARVLGSSVRTSDIVGRAGTSSFYLFLPQCSEKDVNFVIRRMDAKIARQNARGELPARIVLAYEVLSWKPDSPETLKDLLAKGSQILEKLKD